MNSSAAWGMYALHPMCRQFLPVSIVEVQPKFAMLSKPKPRPPDNPFLTVPGFTCQAIARHE